MENCSMVVPPSDLLVLLATVQLKFDLELCIELGLWFSGTMLDHNMVLV